MILFLSWILNCCNLPYVWTKNRNSKEDEPKPIDNDSYQDFYDDNDDNDDYDDYDDDYDEDDDDEYISDNVDNVKELKGPNCQVIKIILENYLLNEFKVNVFIYYFTRVEISAKTNKINNMKSKKLHIRLIFN